MSLQCVESSVGRKAIPCAIMWSLWQNRITHHHVKFNASCGYTEILLTINGCREGMRGCVLMHPKLVTPETWIICNFFSFLYVKSSPTKKELYAIGLASDE